jgi:polysaccharide deacetylase 2 family uncharacterized protein YibQ
LGPPHVVSPPAQTGAQAGTAVPAEDPVSTQILQPELPAPAPVDARPDAEAPTLEAPPSEVTPEPEAAAPLPDPQPAPEAPEDVASIPPVAPEQPAAADIAASLPRIDIAPPPVPLVPQSQAPSQDSMPEGDGVTGAPAPAPSIAIAPDTPSPDVIAQAPSPVFSTTADGSAGGAAPRRLVVPQVQAAPAATDTTPAPAPQPAALATDLPPAVLDADFPEVPPGTDIGLPAPSEAPAAFPPQTPAPPRPPQVAAPLETTLSPGRLPQAGLPAQPEPPPAPETLETVDPEPGPPNALRDNAETFEAEAGAPLMAVVLIDEADSGFDPTALGGLGFPVSFAIDPMRPDAAARAAQLRDAGFEVVILGASALPAGAAPSDVEVALGVARETLPQAVALMDDPASRIQSDRPVLDATVGALAATGHGLIAFPRGLNAAEETARRANVPAATVFRLLDDEDQSAPVITRFLGRAAFAAVQEGAVVVVGRTRPETVTALLSWALSGRTEGVTLAPVSAVLGRLSE